MKHWYVVTDVQKVWFTVKLGDTNPSVDLSAEQEVVLVSESLNEWQL